MHDFIQSLSFSPFAFGSSSGGNTAGAGASRLTTAAAQALTLRSVMRSFGDESLPFTAYRPVPAETRGPRSKSRRAGKKSSRSTHNS